MNALDDARRALANFDAAGPTTVLQTVPALAGSLRALIAAIDVDLAVAVAQRAQFTEEEYARAYELVVSSQWASTSMLQRRLQIGYLRAVEMLQLLTARGVIAPGDGTTRDVLLAPGTPIQQDMSHS